MTPKKSAILPGSTVRGSPEQGIALAYMNIYCQQYAGVDERQFTLKRC